VLKVRIRPKFELNTSSSLEEIVNILREKLSNPNALCTGTILNNGYFILRIPDDQSHFWSPRLTIELEKQDDNSTLVRGLFGPHPAVWMLFAGFYLFFIFVGLVGLFYGLAQWSLKMPPSALWGVPISLVLIGISYGIALIGQNLGLEQMHQLRSFLERSLNSSSVK